MNENQYQKKEAEHEFKGVVWNLWKHGIYPEERDYLKQFLAEAPNGTRARLRQSNDPENRFCYLDVDWVHCYWDDCPHCDGDGANDGVQCLHCNFSGERERKVVYNFSCDLRSYPLEVVDVDQSTIAKSLLDEEFDFS